MEIYSFKAIFEDGTDYEFDELTEKEIRKSKHEAKKRNTKLLYFVEGSNSGYLMEWHTRAAYDCAGNISPGLEIVALLTEAINKPYDPIGVAFSILFARKLKQEIKWEK